MVTDIYPAGEPSDLGHAAALVADAVARRPPHGRCPLRADPRRRRYRAAGILRPGDLCLTLGAGDLTTLPDRFLGAGRPSRG